MEATQLTDPAFWALDTPAFPGVERPPWTEASPGLVWFRTSGSTGAPRWIGHTREGLLLSAAVVNRHLGVTDADVWGLALPLRHVGGFGVVARAFESGAELAVFSSEWDPVVLVSWLEECGGNHLSLVPTQVHDLVKAGLRAPESLRTLVVGGGALAEVDGKAARDLGWPVLPSYGLTEAASQVATGSPELLDQPYYSSSPLPVLPHWEVACDEGGRISIRGKSLFAVEALASGQGMEFIERAEDWFETDDLGRITEAGLDLRGRADFVVKVLGELVDPVAIERKIGLRNGAVVALPDARRQHRLVLVIEEDSSDVSGVLDHYNAGAAGPERLEGPVVIGELPRGELGKIRRAALLEEVIRRFA